MITMRHHQNNPSKSSGDSNFYPKRNNINPINESKVTDVSDLRVIFIPTAITIPLSWIGWEIWEWENLK